MSEEKKKPNLRKDIGELLILAIYLFAEVWAFWEVSHALCLFLAWLGMLALALYDGRLSIRRITAAAATAAILLIAIDLIVPPSLAPQPWRGWLQPARDATPENGCDKPDTISPGMSPVPADTPVVVIGRMGIRPMQGQGTIRVISLGDCRSLTLERSPEGIRINAPIYDASNVLVGQIKQNGYIIQKGYALTVEHTGDLSTLIVHDDKGHELLYLRYANEHAIKVRGIFRCPSAPQFSVNVSETGITIGGTHVGRGCFTVGKIGYCIACTSAATPKN